MNQTAQTTRTPGWVWLAAGAGALVLVAAWRGAGVVDSGRWPIRWIEVSGPLQRVSAHQVRAAAASQVEGGFFRVDLERIRVAVEALAWVAETRVSRRWPDGVAVAVREHTPAAYWRDEQLLSRRGQLFAPTDGYRLRDLPRLYGPAGQLQSVVDKWQLWGGWLAGHGLRIAALQLTERGAWRLYLSHGIEVEIGRRDADRRMRRLVTSLPALRGERERLPVMIDLRYSNGFAVRWSEANEAATRALAGSG